jgi:hypothetical protein
MQTLAEMAMKKALLTGIAALFLATGTAHANPTCAPVNSPDEIVGSCAAEPYSWIDGDQPQPKQIMCPEGTRPGHYSGCLWVVPSEVTQKSPYEQYCYPWLDR